MVEVITNDRYKVLKFLYDNQAIVLGKTVVPLTQEDISKELCFSKMKTNAIFLSLKENELIEQINRGKYQLTDSAIKLVEKMESIEE